MSNVPEKWIKAQDGTLVNLDRVTSIGKDYQEKTDDFQINAGVGGFALDQGESYYDFEVLAEGLSEDEADKFIALLARVLCLRVFKVNPLLDAIRGTLPDTEDGEEMEAR